MQKGSVEELEKEALKAREEEGLRKYYECIGLFYQLFNMNGKWLLKSSDTDKFPNVPRTSLEEFLQDNSGI